jgi:hypothetical protein
LGSSRAGETDSLDRLCDRADWLNRPTPVRQNRKSARYGYGSKAFVAQIVIKNAGATVHREAETFDRKQAANARIAKREAELKSPKGLDRREDQTLASVIER